MFWYWYKFHSTSARGVETLLQPYISVLFIFSQIENIEQHTIPIKHFPVSYHTEAEQAILPPNVDMRSILEALSYQS